MESELLKQRILSLGASEVGFSKTASPFEGLPFAISLVVRLSDPIVDQITDSPTHTYFYHYRTLNAYIDRLGLEVSLLLQNEGYLAAAVPASQSVDGLKAIFSHKQAAVAAGLGWIGKSALFISRKYGSRVRLGTVFTNMPLEVPEIEYSDGCGDCNLCVKMCPAMAISGKTWRPGMAREDFFDARACSDYMKKHFQHIGRGAVCGICVKNCPASRTNV